LAATLADDRSEGVVIATGAALHIALADFALRAAGRWSATGKAIPRALAAMNPGLAAQFTTAFAALFATSNVAPVQSLVDAVLAPARWPASCRIPPSRPGHLACLKAADQDVVVASLG
jgi:hypothetical protein